jgi:hypothetical protein
MSGAISLFPLYTFMTWTGTALSFTCSDLELSPWRPSVSRQCHKQVKAVTLEAATFHTEFCDKNKHGGVGSFQSDAVDGSSPLGRHAVSTGQYLPTFRKIVLPFSSGSTSPI